MTQLAPSQDYGEDQLLDMGVACLSFGEYFANEVNGSLDRESMPLFLPLDYYCRADHLGRCGDVEQEGLALGWRYQDGGLVSDALSLVRASSASGV